MFLICTFLPILILQIYTFDHLKHPGIIPAGLLSCQFRNELFSDCLSIFSKFVPLILSFQEFIAIFVSLEVKMLRRPCSFSNVFILFFNSWNSAPSRSLEGIGGSFCMFEPPLQRKIQGLSTKSFPSLRRSPSFRSFAPE